MTAGVLPRRKNFPTHGPWDRDGSVPGHRKWSGCKKNPGKNGTQGAWRCAEVCGRVHRWAWSLGGWCRQDNNLHMEPTYSAQFSGLESAIKVSSKYDIL